VAAWSAQSLISARDFTLEVLRKPSVKAAAGLAYVWNAAFSTNNDQSVVGISVREHAAQWPQDKKLDFLLALTSNMALPLSYLSNNMRGSYQALLDVLYPGLPVQCLSLLSKNDPKDPQFPQALAAAMCLADPNMMDIDLKSPAASKRSSATPDRFGVALSKSLDAVLATTPGTCDPQAVNLLSHWAAASAKRSKEYGAGEYSEQRARALTSWVKSSRLRAVADQSAPAVQVEDRTRHTSPRAL
jgi:hypothetical protein